MGTIVGKHEGDLAVAKREQVVVSGQVNGDVRLSDGASLVLYGQVVGSVFVGRGTTAELYGMVLGDVVNEGGSVRIAGMVQGQATTRTGKTLIVAGAVISGRRYASDAG